MANDLTKNPIFIDSVMGSAIGTRDGSYDISHIVWDAPTTAAHTAVITDGSTTTLFRATCDAANKTFLFDMQGVTWKNFQVTVLGSGVLLIYLKPRYE